MIRAVLLATMISLLPSPATAQLLYPISATVEQHETGVTVALYVNLMVGCPAFYSAILTEPDTMRLKACYFTTGVFNMAGCTRRDTVELMNEDLSGCVLVVEFNEVGNFTSPAVDTILVSTEPPFPLCAIGINDRTTSWSTIGFDPNAGQLILHSTVDGSATMEWHDVSGHRVHSEQKFLHSGVQYVAPPALPNGVYHITLRLGEKTRTFRVVL